MAWLWVVGGIVLLVVALMFAPFRVTIEYERIKEDDRLDVNVRLLWFIHFQQSIPLMQFKGPKQGIGVAVHSQAGIDTKDSQRDPDSEAVRHDQLRIDLRTVRIWWRKFKHIVRLIKPYDRVIRNLIHTVRLEKFEWNSSVGTGDAASTGVATGGLWAFKGGVVGWISKRVHFTARPLITVSPDFRVTTFQTHLSCIARCAIGHAIIAVVKLVFFWMREGRSWRSIRFKA